ncbi:hypothetical protein [Corynebacterium sp.]|uniref:hypothetical protein n=1 Tax=Corynebacterium sp. TaxID=1720 RepID=UPI0028B17630|nr:hypothetical protein [Corynebacterium sp.]
MDNLTTSLLLAGGGGLIGALLGQISQWVLYSRQQTKENNHTQRTAVADFVSQVRNIQQSRLGRRPPKFEGEVLYRDVYDMNLESFDGNYGIYTNSEPITEEMKAEANEIITKRFGVEIEIDRSEFLRAWDQMSLRVSDKSVKAQASKIKVFMQDPESHVDLIDDEETSEARVNSLKKFNGLLDKLVQTASDRLN